ncbi:MAG TPA: HisA/HisF-related TIM barrel protein [Solirubrobacter sp.]|nr:HisA/HisF-related TIM barrel protein [Solirubrobacter sp.]
MSIASVAVVRVVGVIDLKDGQAVHAVRGERERYRPVHSVITPQDGDPVALARAFRTELGLDEVYVADLDAITGAGSHDDTIAALAREVSLMVDAGVSEPERARRLVELGAKRVIVGTETLTGGLDALLAAIPQLVLSVDLRDGRLLSPDPNLAGLPALDAMKRLYRPGLREAIVLDLARVGSGAGIDAELFAQLHERFDDVELLAGGGVRDADDLRALRDAGAAGALVATALHKGVIGRRELSALSPGG